jgi:hypothetical protein
MASLFGLIEGGPGWGMSISALGITLVADPDDDDAANVEAGDAPHVPASGSNVINGGGDIKSPSVSQAEFLPPVVDRIPAELRALARWVAWAVRGKPGEKPKKIPYDPKLPNTAASSTNPDTWGTFDQAVTAWEEGDRTGIGFVLNSDGLVGIGIAALPARRPCSARRGGENCARTAPAAAPPRPASAAHPSILGKPRRISSSGSPACSGPGLWELASLSINRTDYLQRNQTSHLLPTWSLS